MKITRNPYKLVFSAMVLETNVFLVCAYLWGPSHTPNWIFMPYLAFMAISVIVLLVGERSSRLVKQAQSERR